MSQLRTDTLSSHTIRGRAVWRSPSAHLQTIAHRQIALADIRRNDFNKAFSLYSHIRDSGQLKVNSHIPRQC